MNANIEEVKKLYFEGHKPVHEIASEFGVIGKKRRLSKGFIIGRQHE